MIRCRLLGKLVVKTGKLLVDGLARIFMGSIATIFQAHFHEAAYISLLLD
jgi:hypothetical protein